MTPVAATALQPALVRQLGRQSYVPVWKAMSAFTDARDEASSDELWVVEHEPVFTLGQAGKPEHVLMPGEIPVLHVDRGGQVTYHGPGQLVAYLMLDLRRKKLGVRELVTAMEQALVDVLAGYGIEAAPKADAPGVYVAGDKIASLGLRVRNGCSFHGLALNVDMDMAPFQRINPCGYAGLKMVQLKDLLETAPSLDEVAQRLEPALRERLGYR